MKVNSIEMEKLKFEKEKVNMEFKLREREIALKEKEFDRSKIKPALVALLVAFFGIIGTIIGAWIQGHTNAKLARLKFESDIILKVATSDSNEKNKRNLKFLLEAGFISDPQGNIIKLVNEKDFDFRIESNAQKFEFHNMPMKGIIKELEKRYNVSFAYRGEYASFTASGCIYMTDDLSDILGKIEQIAPLKFLIVENMVTFYPTHKI